MRYINRECDVITGNRDLEVVSTFKRFPVYMGAVESPTSDDEFADMTWMISRSSGMVQLSPVLPLEIVYQKSHGSGTIGALWGEHHKAFALFISQFEPQEVLEIGGGHGHLYFEYQKLRQNNWTIIEPNPNPDLGSRVKVIKQFFGKDVETPNNLDAIVHSHVLEHIYEPREFFESLTLKLKTGKMLLFSVPNLEEMIRKKYLNAINFEHTILLTEIYIEHLLAKYGFKLLDKQKFHEDHSVFYAAAKTEHCVPIVLDCNLYHENKVLVNEYMRYNKDLTNRINSQLVSKNRPTYIFGAHIFTQYLLAFGLDTTVIMGVLDNDNKKQNKRLSGTNLKIFSPEVLRGTVDCSVVMSAGVYNKEIMKQINSYENTKVKFII